MICAPSLIRVFAVRSIGSWGPNVSSCAQWRLWSCPAWSESPLGAKVILLVLSWGGSTAMHALTWRDIGDRSSGCVSVDIHPRSEDGNYPTKGLQCSYEPPHDKTHKMTVRPEKTQISLGIHPDWSESSLCTQWVAKDPSFLHADSGDWSVWSESSLGTQPLCWFWHEAAHIWYTGSSDHVCSYTVDQIRLKEPAHEIMALFVLRKLILQTRMNSHPMGLDFWFLVGLFVYFMCVKSECSGKTARMHRLAWAFAGHLCDKYHNLMSWLKGNLMIIQR